MFESNHSLYSKPKPRHTCNTNDTGFAFAKWKKQYEMITSRWMTVLQNMSCELISQGLTRGSGLKKGTVQWSNLTEVHSC